jgi:hypothetical protein
MLDSLETHHGRQKIEPLSFKYPSYNVIWPARPNRDCVGNQFSIFNILMTRNIKCNIIKNYNYGSILPNVVDSQTIVNNPQFDPTLLGIGVDCSDFKRLGCAFVKNMTNYIWRSITPFQAINLRGIISSMPADHSPPKRGPRLWHTNIAFDKKPLKCSILGSRSSPIVLPTIRGPLTRSSFDYKAKVLGNGRRDSRSKTNFKKRARRISCTNVHFEKIFAHSDSL